MQLNVEWASVSGDELFTLLVAAAFGLVPAHGENTGRYADMWTRFSPFECLYDLMERLSEVGWLVWDGSSWAAGDESMNIVVHSGRGGYSRTVLRFVGASSSATLFFFRHARETQLVAASYVVCWILSHVHVVRPRNTSRASRIYPTANVLFATVCHLLVLPSGPMSLTVRLANAALVCAGAGVAWTFGDGIDSDHNFVALSSQATFITGLSALWLFAYSPVVLSRSPPPDDASDYEKVTARLLAPAIMHGCAFLFVISRRSLIHARAITKAIVGLMWICAGACYYHYVYQASSTFDGPVAQVPKFSLSFGS